MLNARHVLIFLLLFPPASASVPEYFTPEIDKEYRAVLRHIAETLPETDTPLAYLPSFSPFNFLDIQATKLRDPAHRQAFSNFNLGVLGRQRLNISQDQLTQLPNLFICKASECTKQRIARVRQFLDASQPERNAFAQNDERFIVQQMAGIAFRINHTFYSPTQLITYSPSEHAGFIPSANYTISTPQDSPGLIALLEITRPLLQQMAEHQVSAITKVAGNSLNIIFNGISDNHWGVVTDHGGPIPSPGDISPMGLTYDVVKQVDTSAFYYQTN